MTSSNPYSVLSKKTNEDFEQGSHRRLISARSAKRVRGNGSTSNLAPSQAKKKIQNRSHDKIELTSGKKLPFKVRPMLAYPVDKAFDNKDWAFEVKWDGLRAIAYKEEEGEAVRIQSRNGNDITQKYPEITNALENLPATIHSAVFDGEIVVLNDMGLPDFQGHQHRMHVNDKEEIEGLSKDIPATYYIFDILYYDGEDVKTKSYLERRQILSKIISPDDFLKVSEFVEEKGSPDVKTYHKI